MTVLASYAIFRLWLPRLFAIAGCAFFCISPIHLEQVAQLRDYSKAPFILAAIPFIVIVALRPLTLRRLLIHSALCGFVVGVGMGFRMDVAIIVPIFLFGLLLFRGRRPWSELPQKGVAAAAFLLVLTIVSMPIVANLSAGGSNAVHTILLGYTDPFDAGLRVTDSLYGFGPFYNDDYIASTVRSYYDRIYQEQVRFPSAAYDAACRTLWFEIIRNFPADVFTRTLAAAAEILNLPFNNPDPQFLNIQY
jgi:hypothetical protein